MGLLNSVLVDGEHGRKVRGCLKKYPPLVEGFPFPDQLVLAEIQFQNGLLEISRFYDGL
jgi:hypothetical protein